MGRKLVRAKDLERRRAMAAFDQVLQEVDASCRGWTACCLDCDAATERCADREAVQEWKARHQAASRHEVMMHREWESPDGLSEVWGPAEGEPPWMMRG